MSIAIDVGRKRTRIGYDLESINVVASSYKVITGNDTVRKDIDVRTDHFTIKKCPRLSLSGQTFVKPGAYSLFSGRTVEASNSSDKADQDSTYLNTAFGIAESIVMNRLDANHPIQLGLCVPAREFYSPDFEVFKERLAGDYIINFPVLSREVSFSIKQGRVNILAEGVAALYTMLSTNMRDRVLNSNIMIVDGGYGSLDLTPVKKMVPQGHASGSFKEHAGTVFESMIASALEREKFSTSSEAVTNAIELGQVEDSGSFVPVGYLVKSVKEEYAGMVVSSMEKTAAKAEMSVKDFSYLFPVGRSFITGGVENTETYTGDLADMIMNLWPERINRLDLPDIEIPNLAKTLNKTHNRVDGRENRVEMLNKFEVANVRGIVMAMKANGL
jgi:hypothetical protein